MSTSSLERVRTNFERYGARDPFYAVLTDKRYKGNRWDPQEFYETGRREVRAVFRELAEAGIRIGSGRVLDFGCGVGRLTQALAEDFGEVVGVDIAESMLEVARRHNRHGDRCRYVHNTSEDLRQFASASFDLVYSNITLQHVPPPLSVGYIREFLRILRPGGWAVFQLPAGRVPDSATWYGRWRGFRVRVLAPVWRTLKAWTGKPVVLTYGVVPARVAEVVQENGGTLVASLPSYDTGLDWESYRYCVRRNPP